MGQTSSIVKYNYDSLMNAIVNSAQYKDNKWSSKQGPTTTHFWRTGKNKSRFVIDKFEWPFQETSEKDFITDHHYFYLLTSDGKKYYFDLDQNKWVFDQPPSQYDKYIQEWHDLLNNLEAKKQQTGGANSLESINSKLDGLKSKADSLINMFSQISDFLTTSSLNANQKSLNSYLIQSKTNLSGGATVDDVLVDEIENKVDDLDNQLDALMKMEIIMMQHLLETSLAKNAPPSS